MTLYFEFNECIVGGPHRPGYVVPAKYCVRHESGMFRQLMLHRIMSLAEKVWQEDDDGVKFIKHRSMYLDNAEVDMKEFLFVKLSAVEI